MPCSCAISGYKPLSFCILWKKKFKNHVSSEHLLQNLLRMNIFPKIHPLLFQWPREFAGEKVLPPAKMKICVPFCLSCFTNNKNTFCQLMSKYSVQSRVETFLLNNSLETTHILLSYRCHYPSVFSVFCLCNYFWLKLFWKKLKWKLLYQLDNSSFCLFLSLLFL